MQMGSDPAALDRIWMLGDVHGEFRYLHRALQDAPAPPRWLVFAGDVDIDTRPFSHYLAPFRQQWPMLKVAFIHGNHDADTHEHWACLHDCGDATPLHNRVADLDGVRMAGLGGVFQQRAWWPGSAPRFHSKAEALGGGAQRFRDGQRPKPQYRGAIYPAEVDNLSQLQADVLVMHEAPSCHRHGFAVLDDMTRCLGVARVFHGHHHDDCTDAYRPLWPGMGFETYALGSCGIRTASGRVVLEPQAF